MTKSMQIALSDLALDHLAVIYPGAARYRLGPRVVAVPAATLDAISWRDLATR